MKFVGVDISDAKISTKNFFYLELKRNQQIYRLSAEEITIRLQAPPIINGNNYDKTFALKLVTPRALSFQYNVR
jgi:hypothetical protein